MGFFHVSMYSTITSGELGAYYVLHIKSATHSSHTAAADCVGQLSYFVLNKESYGIAVLFG